MPPIEIVSIGTHWPSGGFVYTSYAVYWQIYLAIVTGLFLSNENTIGPAIDLLALVLREASRDR